MSDPRAPQGKSAARTDDGSPRRAIIMNVLLGAIGISIAFVFSIVNVGDIFGKNPGAESNGSFSIPTVLVSILAAIAGAAFAAVVQVYVARSIEKRKRKQDIDNKRNKLSADHPELVDLIDILEYDSATTGGRSFWASFTQNVFFLGLGVALPIVIQRLHWFQ